MAPPWRRVCTPKIPSMGICRASAASRTCHWPDAAPGLRLDIGVDAGDEVSTFYDPMLGKVIAWGESRGEAVDRLHKALADIEIVGVTTNRALLLSVLADGEFRRGGVTTSFLDARAAQLSFGEPKAGDADAVFGGAVVRDPPDGVRCAVDGHSRLAAGGAAAQHVVFGDRTVIIELSERMIMSHTLRAGERLAGGGTRCAARKTLAGHGRHSPGHEYALHVVARGAQALDVEVAGQMQRVSVVEVDQTLASVPGGAAGRRCAWCERKMPCRSAPARRKARCSRRCRGLWSPSMSPKASRWFAERPW